MDVSYSAWRHSTPESIALKGDSFSFLFDRRYTNRLNRMSRIFFEAYAKATKELSAQEDRFPSLSEIDAKMESGAVYAFKDRLTKNTEFFDEIKISGVSYLVPKAVKFIDASGMYTDLVFDFNSGSVTLPTRRKMPVDVAANLTPDHHEEPEEDINEDFETPAEALKPQVTPQTAAQDRASEDLYIDAEDTTPVSQTPAQAPIQASAQASPQAAYQVAPEKPSPQKDSKARADGFNLTSKPIIIVAAALLVIILAGAIILRHGPMGAPVLVEYSAYLTNSSNITSLDMDIKNPNQVSSDLEMSLPTNSDKSISVRGGMVTISHTSSTVIRMNSSGDASIKVYLNGNWTSIPINLNLSVPGGYDSGVVVHGQNYNVNRKDDKILLRFNGTHNATRFEQSFTPRR